VIRQLFCAAQSRVEIKLCLHCGLSLRSYVIYVTWVFNISAIHPIMANLPDGERARPLFVLPAGLPWGQTSGV